MKSGSENFLHTRDRARERYGVNLSADDYHTMNDLIVQGKARRVASPDDDKEAYVVSLCGTTFLAVFNPLTARVETVLPKPKDFPV